MKNQKELNKTIDALAASEKVTKSALADLSRDLLVYVPETKDIAMVNRLLTVLTPMNCKVAQQFFRTFLPWHMPADDTVFGAMLKGDKRIANKLVDIEAFLANAENNIWSWANKNIDVVAKPKNYAKKISDLISKAIGDDEQGLNELDILKAVVNGGLSVDQIINEIDKVAKEIEPTH